MTSEQARSAVIEYGEIVRKGRLDPVWARFYDRVSENRQRADYQELVVFEEDQVGELCRSSRGFVSQMRRLLTDLRIDPSRQSAARRISGAGTAGGAVRCPRGRPCMRCAQR